MSFEQRLRGLDLGIALYKFIPSLEAQDKIKSVIIQLNDEIEPDGMLEYAYRTDLIRMCLDMGFMSLSNKLNNQLKKRLRG